jgi:divalent metal cation (Fe/Co/Zn/Cd) transporter
MMTSMLDHTGREDLYRLAYALALITIFYNILEGLVSIFFGMEDETVSLLGFGIDSFVEVISGIGIWHMIRRIRSAAEESIDAFERQALRVTGTAFYFLTAGLLATSAFNLYQGHAPKTTFWGIVISLVSILSMWALIHYKTKVGKGLGSEAILADAACTRACMQLSVVLLLASTGYELTGMGGLDSIGAILIALLTFREGREAFEKARQQTMTCCCGGKCGNTTMGIGDSMPK